MTISEFNNITKSVRSFLIDLSQLNEQFVRNALSEYGSSLDKNDKDSIFTSITTNDLMLLFEISPTDNDDDVSMTEFSGEISYFKTMVAKIIVYGKSSDITVLQMIGNLRSDAARNKLLSNEFYLKDVSEPKSIREYKNNVLWFRTDFSFTFAVHLTFNQTFDGQEFKSVQIIKEGDVNE